MPAELLEAEAHDAGLIVRLRVRQTIGVIDVAVVRISHQNHRNTRVDAGKHVVALAAGRLGENLRREIGAIATGEADPAHDVAVRSKHHALLPRRIRGEVLGIDEELVSRIEIQLRPFRQPLLARDRKSTGPPDLIHQAFQLRRVRLRALLGDIPFGDQLVDERQLLTNPGRRSGGEGRIGEIGGDRRGEAPQKLALGCVGDKDDGLAGIGFQELGELVIES